MGDYISDFDIYRTLGKIFIIILMIFFIFHMVIFLYSIAVRGFLSTEHTPATPPLMNKRMSKLIEKEMLPTFLIIVVTIIVRGLTVESAIVMVVLIIGYIALLIGECLNRPDLKIIGRVGYGMAATVLCA